MIVVDTEFTGFDFNKYGMWQIGAIDLGTMEEFLEEARLDDEDETLEDALKIVGKTEEELRAKSKQSQKQLLQNFFKWLENRKIKNFICHNPQWDFGFIIVKAQKNGLEIPFNHRAFDLHSIAQTKFFEVNREFFIKKNHSDMSMPNLLKFCGLKDERMDIRTGKKGKPHNALEDAKLEAECFSRLIYGKNLLLEFAKLKIPKYLK